MTIFSALIHISVKFEGDRHRSKFTINFATMAGATLCDGFLVMHILTLGVIEGFDCLLPRYNWLHTLNSNVGKHVQVTSARASFAVACTTNNFYYIHPFLQRRASTLRAFSPFTYATVRIARLSVTVGTRTCYRRERGAALSNLVGDVCRDISDIRPLRNSHLLSTDL